MLCCRSNWAAEETSLAGSLAAFYSAWVLAAYCAVHSCLWGLQ
jgi:hypothetical protein